MKIVTTLARLLTRLFRREDGVILIEFAYTVPIILMLLIGGFETFRILMMERKTNQTINSVANLIAQNQLLSSAMITDTFNAVDNIMAPFQVENNGRVIVSKIRGTADKPIIANQCLSNTGTTFSSKLGSEGNDADVSALPGNFTLDEGDIIVVAEIFFTYTPFFLDTSFLFDGGVFTQRNIYHVAVHSPRFSDVTFTEGCP
tara:strand:+ start:5134 stop:5739 length:606 start_codon:yes stop_codon:yes gene_type:complete